MKETVCCKKKKIFSLNFKIESEINTMECRRTITLFLRNFEIKLVIPNNNNN